MWGGGLRFSVARTTRDTPPPRNVGTKERAFVSGFAKKRVRLYSTFPPVLSACPLRTNSGCGKKEAHIDWSMVIPEKAAPVT